MTAEQVLNGTAGDNPTPTITAVKPSQPATTPTDAPQPRSKNNSLSHEERENILFWKEIGLAVLWVIFLIISTVAAAKKLKG